MAKLKFPGRARTLGLSLLLPVLQVAAAPRPALPATPLVFDENRHMVVDVTLTSLVRPAVTRTFRFILDTGAATTMLDVSVPAEFYSREDPDEPTLRVHRLAVGGFAKEEVRALRMDFKHGAVGRFQDRPVDGILGMSFLDGTRFTLRPRQGELQWNPPPIQGGTPLHVRRDLDGLPYLRAQVDGADPCLCLLDTGSTRGVELPSRLRPGDPLRQEVQHGFDGTPTPTLVYAVARLQLGAAHVDGLEAEVAEGTTVGNLGQDFWAQAPVCFDFENDLVTFSRNPDGTVPTTPASRPLPVVWDRRGPAPALVVATVVPGSALDRLGCRPGDRVLRAGGLEGAALTRAALKASLVPAGPSSWTVVRGNRELELTAEVGRPALPPVPLQALRR